MSEFASQLKATIFGIPASVLLSIVVVIVALAFLAIVKRVVRSRIRKLEENESAGVRVTATLRTIHTVIRYVVIFVAVLTILDINGVDVGAIAAAAGAAGIILGFALKDVLEDFAMGARIVTDGYFKVGDVVKMADEEGIVIAITPQSTKIRSINDESIVTLSNRLLQHVSVSGGFDDIDIPLEYELPSDAAQELLEGMCLSLVKHENISDAKCLGVTQFGESGIIYKIRIWTDAQNRPQTMRDARSLVKRTLDERGMSIPYSRVNVHEV